MPNTVAPIAIEIGEHQVVARLTERAMDAREFETGSAIRWIHERGSRAVVVDITALERLNSTMIRWLLECRTLAGPQGITVRGARSAVRQQFAQLGLDRLFTLA